MKTPLFFFTFVVSFVIVALVVGCGAPPLMTAAQWRDSICAGAPHLPPSPQVDVLLQACAESKPLSDVAAAFERCEQ